MTEVLSEQITLPAEIFRAYDIRGIVDKTLTKEVVFNIGRAIGSFVVKNNETKIVVARDGRISGPKLLDALISGLATTGLTVVNVGVVPTPVLYFATKHLDIPSGIMLTGSHNPVNYNGLKIMLNGKAIYGEQILAIKNKIESQQFIVGKGSLLIKDIADSYIEYITNNLSLSRPLKIVVDCGNGVAGGVAPKLYQSLGCEVIPLYCEIDGNFPNHHPDPGDPKNLQELQQTVIAQNADLGIAFDGDGDRLGVVDNKGKIIWPDRVLMLLAKELLASKPGANIIFDIKCTADLSTVINDCGGNAILWKTGHSLIKAKMQETGALLAGEMSGHIFYKDGWFGFDDALYAGARLLEILAKINTDAATVFDNFPEKFSTPEIAIDVSEAQKFIFVDKLTENIQNLICSNNATNNLAIKNLITIDGIRVEFNGGWGLIRPSNTTPKLIARFEADNQETLDLIKEFFKIKLLEIDSNLQVEF